MIDFNVKIARYECFIATILRRMRFSATPLIGYDDAFQIGRMAIVTAVSHYDERLGLCTESSFVYRRIHHAIRDYKRDHDDLPSTLARRLRAIHGARGRFRGKTGRLPNDLELAQELGITTAMLDHWRDHHDKMQREIQWQYLERIHQRPWFVEDYREEIALAMRALKQHRPDWHDIVYRLFWLEQPTTIIMQVHDMPRHQANRATKDALAFLKKQLCMTVPHADRMITRRSQQVSRPHSFSRTAS